MVNIKKFISEIILEFKKELNSNNFKDFVAYFYFTMNNRIDSVKRESIKNKYIKIRKDVLKYIIANERAITSEIRKSKNK
jgi:hypothetical protein